MLDRSRIPGGARFTKMHSITLRGACTHNLKALDLDIEPGTLLVICGPSGAGKSSLAFGTLYAEGQRRYVESFSAYARQFLERLARPPIASLQWMPAAIAVDRGGQVKTSRSTVATLTELSDYIKQLWALGAELDCPRCGAKVTAKSPESAAADVIGQLPERKVVVSYPLRVGSEEEFLTVRDALIGSGYRRLLLAGQVRDLDSVPPSEAFAGEPRGELGSKRKRSRAPADGVTLYVVADRTTTEPRDRARLVEALEVAFERGAGQSRVATPDGEQLDLWRELCCQRCGERFRKPSPGLFSFNSPLGACEQCRGFGRTIGVDWDKVLPDPAKTIADGAVRVWAGKSTAHERKLLLRHCKRTGIPLDVPLGQLSTEQTASLIEGDGGGWRNGYPGLRRWFAWLETRAYKMHVRVLLARYRSYDPCSACGGMRFKAEALGYKLGGMALPELYAMEASAALGFIERELLRAPAHPPLQRVLQECRVRLQTLCDVGLGYLTLDRAARSLSGGELQRVNLASALDSRLTGTLFVLDEPSAGLHPADVAKLVPLVQRLTAGDNIVAVVESDEAFLAGADRVVELGPGSGDEGGAIVFDGTPAVLHGADTNTGRWLRAESARSSAERRAPRGEIVLSGARGHNLRDAELHLPIGVLTCVTGVSGSGKSSLILETLLPAVARALGTSAPHPLPFDQLSGVEAVAGVVTVDQSPLGRTSRGNVATYLGAWDQLRRSFAATALAKERGYKPGMFSFNVAGGRCEACRGEGSETVEMQFLADVRFSCPECGGRRFVGPVLDVRVADLSVADVLALSVSDAIAHLHAHPAVVRTLAPLLEVGAGYLRLGQPLSTLSGGEAQRLKLAAALSGVKPGSLIALDEPTSGLHGGDVPPLLACVDRLVEAGHTVVIVEHDMRVVAHADHVIDLGPGAGALGGRVVACGTPEAVAAGDASPTAGYLRAALGPRKRTTRGGTTGRAAVREGSLQLIRVRAAHEHNLQRVDVDLPRGRFVVVTGPSGSGKSSLAFDVVFAESQRRYLETLSPYVRQYLKQLPRPQVDSVEGVPPSVALQQRHTAGAKNSTVATVTEVAHYLRVLYARAGLLHCQDCALPIAPRSREALIADVTRRYRDRPVTVLAAVVRGQKGAHRELLATARDSGIRRARIDGEVCELAAGMSLSRYREHTIELWLGVERGGSQALRGLLEQALSLAAGTACVLMEGEELLLSTERACPRCGRGYPELDPRFFSFNTRQGACADCEGQGQVERRVGRKRTDIARVACPGCGGRRLAGLALHTRLSGVCLPDLLALSVDAALQRISAIALEGRALQVGELPLSEAVLRLRFLQRVGLGYLALDRAAFTLSGGEMQRVRLAGQLGSGLTGVLYVLDEPTIGLHPRDTTKLLAAIADLVGQGCSVLVVEHDADTIRAADHMIDVGPGGGHEGGRIVAEGPPTSLLRDPRSVTGRSLVRAPIPARRRPPPSGPWVEIQGAREHNLQQVDLRIPPGRLCAVTGVSGSGKSTLVREVALRAVRRALGLQSDAPGAHDKVKGLGGLRRAVEIDQSPIGRTPRSVPATYLGVWDEIRKLYAQTPEARARGYGASRFSFNVKKGRCAACEGQGVLNVEMSFLPDAQVACEACDGMRYDAETLAVRLSGVHIGELLAMHVDEAARLFAAFPHVHRPLELMCDLGLGYLKLGQPSNTLSGGEAQRLKLISELSSGGAGPTLYVMDEPTTGLHREDVARLLTVLDKLVDRGDTVLTIEHHLDVIGHADWVIDLGPEAGDAGGRIVFEGTPEQLMRARQSHTGKALLRELGRPQRDSDAASSVQNAVPR